MRKSLRTQLTVLIIAASILPLLLVGFIFAQRILAAELAQGRALQSEIAQRVATEVDAYMQEVENDLRLLGSDIRGEEESDRAQQLSRLLGAFSSGEYRNVYEEFTIVEVDGQELLRVSRSEIVSNEELQNLTGTDVFEETKATRNTYIGPVQIDEDSGNPFMTIGIPLFEPRSVQISSVLVAKIRFDAISNLIAQLQLGNSETIYILNEDGTVVAHQEPSAGFVGMTGIQTEDVAGDQQGLTGDNVLLSAEELVLGQQQLFVVAEILESATLELFNNVMLTLSIIIVMTLIVAGFLGFLAARQIVKPISDLAATSEAIAAGDLTQRVNVTTQNEIGTLSNSFNNMTDRIVNLINSLELRVEERTRGIATSSDVGRRLSTILDQEELVEAVVTQIQAAFNYYHVHIYVLDAQNKNLVMVGGTGKASQMMLASNHQIPLGKGLVGRAALTNTPVLVADVENEAEWLPNPLLTETKAETAVPISVGERVLGVLDVQENKIDGLTESDVELLVSITNQIAIAMQNAEYLETTQKRAQQEVRSNEIGRKIQNAKSVEQALQIATRELGRALGAPKTRIRLKNIAAQDTNLTNTD